jgi:Sec-independent protein translocase protein TatA
MFVLLVLGVLLYGRNLPEAGRKLGRVTAQLRRGFNEFKDQMNRDAEVGELKRTLQSTKEELRRATSVKRAVTEPAKALQDLTYAKLSSPLSVEEDEPEGEVPADTPAAESKKAAEGAD